jgi:hypothetical protein
VAKKEMQKEQRVDRQKVEGRCVGRSGEDAQSSLLLFSIILFIYSAYLYLYSLRPYSFAIL